MRSREVADAVGEAPDLEAEAAALRETIASKTEKERAVERLAAVEQCEFGLRQRRTYDEIAGTDGHGIITIAGLKPWAPLTARQQAILAERERDQEERQRQAAAFAGEFMVAQAEAALRSGVRVVGPRPKALGVPTPAGPDDAILAALDSPPWIA
jgi:hypothetical protein